jgi:oxygen-independent coproporphyrinogen-3 oxidase
MQTDFNFDLLALHRQYIDILCTENMAVLSHDILLLTKKGKMLADKIASDLFVVK